MIKTICLALAALTIAAQAEFDWSIDTELRTWLIQPDGEATLTTGGLPGDSLDFDRDAGLDAPLTLEGRLYIGADWLFLGGSHSVWSADGGGALSRDLAWGGVQYRAGERVDSELDIEFSDIVLQVRQQAGFGPVRFEVGARRTSLDLNLASVDYIENSGGATAWVGFGGIELGLDVHPQARVNLKARVQTFDADYYDLEASLDGRRGGFTGKIGFRMHHFDVSEGGFALDTDFSGPFAELGYSW